MTRNRSRTAGAGRTGSAVLAVVGTTGLLVAALATPAAAADDVELDVDPGRSAGGAWSGQGAPATVSAGFTVPELPTGTLYLALDAAAAGSGDGVEDGYRARVKVQPDGSLVVGTSKLVDGRESWYTSTAVEGGVEAGDVVNLEADFSRASDGELAVRAWPGGEERPGWQHDVEDAGAAVVTGEVVTRPWTYLSSGASAGLVVDVGEVQEPPAPEPVRAPGRPGPGNTGVPDGTRLTDHWGDLVITTPGAHYDALDVHGFVVVQAPDVTITRSKVRGGEKSGNRGLVTVDDRRSTGFTIEDSTLVPDHPSVWYDGIKGSGFTARRVDVSGVVDNVKVYGDDVLVEDSWLHDSSWFADDPNQRGGPTHNDGVQVLGGSDITVRGSTITGASNGGMQVTQDHSPVRGLDFSGNWVDDGTCSVKVSDKGEGSAPQVRVADNRFGTSQTIAGCAVLATWRTDLSVTGNVWELTGLPVVPVRFG